MQTPDCRQAHVGTPGILKTGHYLLHKALRLDNTFPNVLVIGAEGRECPERGLSHVLRQRRILHLESINSSKRTKQTHQRPVIVLTCG